MEKEEKDYNIFDWWKKAVFQNYANFEGRARRSEYWSFVLISLVLIGGGFFLATFIDSLFPQSNLIFLPYILVVLYALAMILPSFAVAVRRLHDTNKSGLWVFSSMIPMIGPIFLIVKIVFYCLEGDAYSNDYGPDPKNPNDNSYYGGGSLNLSDAPPPRPVSIFSEPPPPPQFSKPSSKNQYRD